MPINNATNEYSVRVLENSRPFRADCKIPTPIYKIDITNKELYQTVKGKKDKMTASCIKIRVKRTDRVAVSF